jgi:hypothetical protein
MSYPFANGFGQTATRISGSPETTDAAECSNSLHAGLGSGTVICTSTFPSSILTG